MKRIFIILFVVFCMMNRTYAKDIDTLQVVLSKDKSTISVVGITAIEKHNSVMMDDEKVYDTLVRVSIYEAPVIFYSSKEARNYLNPKIAKELIDSNRIFLVDSLLPRRTHLFGKDTIIRRLLYLIYGCGNDSNKVLIENGNKVPVRAFCHDYQSDIIGFTLITLTISLLLLFGTKSKKKAFIMVAVPFVGILISNFTKADLILLDKIIIPAISVIPACLVLIFIPKRKYKK